MALGLFAVNSPLLKRGKLNQELVKQGWCCWYRKYAPDNMIFAELQLRARGPGLALWADPDPVPPGTGENEGFFERIN